MDVQRIINARRKALTALVGATIATIPLLSGGVTNAELVAIVTVYASALGVYTVTNK